MVIITHLKAPLFNPLVSNLVPSTFKPRLLAILRAARQSFRNSPKLPLPCRATHETGQVLEASRTMINLPPSAHDYLVPLTCRSRTHLLKLRFFCCSTSTCESDLRMRTCLSSAAEDPLLSNNNVQVNIALRLLPNTELAHLLQPLPLPRCEICCCQTSLYSACSGHKILAPDMSQINTRGSACR